MSDQQRELRDLLHDLIREAVRYPEVVDSAFSLREWIRRCVRLKLAWSLMQNGHEVSTTEIPGRTPGLLLASDSVCVEVRLVPRQQLWRMESYGDPAPSVPSSAAHSVVLLFPYDSNDVQDIRVIPAAGSSSDSVGYVRNLIVDAITRKSDRDRQIMPGPSDLADPCDLCLGEKILSVLRVSMGHVALLPVAPRRDSFSLKAWVGTAVHERLECALPQVWPQAIPESTVDVADIPGLGQIKGHVDLTLEADRAIVDYKTTDLKKLQDYRGPSGVPVRYMNQTMLYLLGARRSGVPVDHAALVFIPRDAVHLEDIWVASCSYRQDVAEDVLLRAQEITERILSGSVANLSSDPDCFVCARQR